MSFLTTGVFTGKVSKSMTSSSANIIAEEYAIASSLWQLPEQAISALSSKPSEKLWRFPSRGERAFQQLSCSTEDTHTGSRNNLELAKLWINDCLQNHNLCKIGNSTGQGKLPTRLIDVTDYDHPFVFETKNQTQSSFVTLSYCWGTSKRLLTTKANYIKHQKCLPIARLPQTFQDAIYAANGLGFRFLWIDALCIIQDSPEDIEKEMAVMGDIFEQSVLTLSAEGGLSADAGLFVRRDPRWYHPCQLEMSAHAGLDKTKQTVFVYAHEEQKEKPLMSRGWVLQEEILSTRSLTFGCKMLAWKCTTGIADETDPEIHERLDFENKLGTAVEKARLRLRDPTLTVNRNSWEKWNVFDIWYDIIRIYSNRSLSYRSDSLNALMGLANRLATKHSCLYLGGLWKEDLPVGLDWFVCRDERLLLTANPRPDYIAPSWSWAAIPNCRKDFDHWSRVDGVRVFEDTKAQVLEASPSAVSGPMNGEQAFLKLRGLFKEGYLSDYEYRRLVNHPDDDEYENRSERTMEWGGSEIPRWKSLVYDQWRRRLLGDVALDMPFDFIDPPNQYKEEKYVLVKVWLLLLYVEENSGFEDGGRKRLTCLVLVPTHRTASEYRRVGLVRVGNADFDNVKKWLREACLADVTIV